MAESADKTPSEPTSMSEESDVMELTEEVEAPEDAEAHDDPEVSDEVDAMAMDMPAFKMPGEEGEKEASPEDEEYDRQSMVKTIQMDALDRETVEAMGSDDQETSSAVLAVVTSEQFAPTVIPRPPEVLVKKWRGGLPGEAQRILGPADNDAAPAKTVPDTPEPPMEAPPAEEPEVSAEKEQGDEEEGPSEAPDAAPTQEMKAPPTPEEDKPQDHDKASQEAGSLPDLPVDEEMTAISEVEPIELDEDLLELQEDSEPGPTLTSQSASLEAEATQDSEMKGLVKELMEEEKEEVQRRQGKIRPRDIWFKEVFSEEYLRTVPSNIAQITRKESDFIEASLNPGEDSLLLDLACGYGRHSIDLANRGYQMVGLDLSKPLLRRALGAAQQRELDIKFVHGDMRELSFKGIFDGCFIWDTSLGYFKDRVNLNVLRGVHRGLKMGGRLLIDVVNRDFIVRQTPTRLWWEGNGCIFLEESEFDYETSVLEVDRSYIYEDGSPPLEQTSYIRLYSVHELRQMLHVAGFKVLEVSGAHHHRGHFLGVSSERVIMLAEKRARRRRPSKTGAKRSTNPAT